jgi:hypothetical protein
LHGLSEGSAVTYSNIFLAAAISSPVHPVWQWLAKRSGRIDGLSLGLRPEEDKDDLSEEDEDDLSDWMQPLETISGIPGAQLRVELVERILDLDHPFITQWLKQHGQHFSHVSLGVETSFGLSLREFAEAAAPCRSINLDVSHDEVVDLSDLDPVAGSLRSLTLEHGQSMSGSILMSGNVNVFSSMSQLTALHLISEDLWAEEPWAVLAELTGLQQLSLDVIASGDPSPLSALTGLIILASPQLWP